MVRILLTIINAMYIKPSRMRISCSDDEDIKFLEEQSPLIFSQEIFLKRLKKKNERLRRSHFQFFKKENVV